MIDSFAKPEGVSALAMSSLDGNTVEMTAGTAARSAQLRQREINVGMLVAMKAARNRLQPIQIEPIAAALSCVAD
jgi:hypothetical protein